MVRNVIFSAIILYMRVLGTEGFAFGSFKIKNHLLHSVAFMIPNRLILLDKSPDTVAIWDYEKPN